MLRDTDRDAALALAAALAQGSRHPLARAFTAARRLHCLRSTRARASPAVASAESSTDAAIGSVARTTRCHPGRQRPDLDDAVILADDDGAIAAFQIDERLQPGARAAVDALPATGSRSRSQAETRRRKSQRWPRAGHQDLGCAPSARGQARLARVASTEWRARRRRGRRRERRSDARRRRCRGRRELSRRRRPGNERHRRSPASSTHLRKRECSRSRCCSILQQNRRWALGYNLAAIPLAALGFVPPWLAAIGMSASSLAVVLNALRIGRAPGTDAGDERWGRDARGDPSPERIGMNSLVFLIPLSILLLVGAGHRLVLGSGSRTI